MRVRAAAASDVGQVREGNEDSYLVLDPLFAVADGMGGARGGEVASNLALDTIRRLFEHREGSLVDQVVEANRAVFERSKADRSVAGMGTTLTAALVEGGRVRLAHIGDSRAYLLRDGELHLLTEDHTLVQRMVQEGEISQDEARTHPHRSVLTRALGTEDSVQVDEGVLDARDGDRLLLCSDGLTGMVSEEEIRSVLERTPDPQRAVEQLVEEANEAGGVDNITAVILDLTEDGDEDRSERTTSEAGSDRASTATPAFGTPSPSDRTSESPVSPFQRGRLSPRATRLVIVRAGIALAIFVVAIVGLRIYLDSQWFVGVSDGRVAIFRGVPMHLGGLDLNSVVVETTISAEDAEALALYRDLPDGITADDRQGADAIVEQIRQDVEQAARSSPSP